MKNWIYQSVVAFLLIQSAVAQSVTNPARIEVYVTPYYDSKGPVINVGQFSQGLAATSESEFVATIAKMRRSWNALRFPEMYVAGNRLYDLGFRNEATYWFYSAQYRGRLFAILVDQEKMGSIGAPAFELLQAANAFQQLVGPYVNGFAFGDINRVIDTVAQVQRENKAVPDLEKLYPGITFRPQTRWNAENKELNEGLTRFLTMLKEQKASLKKTRIENGTEAKFSRLSSRDLPAEASR